MTRLTTQESDLLVAENGQAILTEQDMHIRTNFLLGGWYVFESEDFQDVVDFAEGRTGDPFYV